MRRKLDPMTIYTVGHSTRSAAELIGLLADAGVDFLVDVRAFPRSRTNPQFNVDSLPTALALAGIGYRHLKALGGRRGRQDLGFASPNGYWQVGAFRNYADYALTPGFKAGLAELLALARSHTCAVMCAEALWYRCHRRIVTDYLLTAGFDVVHILGADKNQPARLTPGAEPRPDGALHYPPAQGALL